MEAIIFDVDGVLVDTHALHVSALKRAIDKHGFPGLQENPNDTRTTLEKLRSWSIPEDLIPQIYETKKFIYNNEVHAWIKLRPEIYFLVKQLGKKYKMGICSNSNMRSVMRSLTLAGLHELFDVFVCGGMTQKGKPHWTPYQLCHELLRCSAYDCLVFEDSDDGVASATTAGCRVIRTSYATLEKDIEDASHFLSGR